MRGVVQRNPGKIYPFIDRILKVLFQAEERRLRNLVLKMNKQNNEVFGKAADGFTYQGKPYRCTGLLGKIQMPPLHESLHQTMDIHLADVDLIENDKKEISQLLFKLLEPAQAFGNFQSLRDAIPECVIDTMPDEIRTLSRCSQPTFFLNHPRDVKLYNEVLLKLEFYSAARLLY